jgi:hypothetical protein
MTHIKYEDAKRRVDNRETSVDKKQLSEIDKLNKMRVLINQTETKLLLIAEHPDSSEYTKRLANEALERIDETIHGEE